MVERAAPGTAVAAEEEAWLAGLALTPAERLQWLEDTMEWARAVCGTARRVPAAPGAVPPRQSGT